MNGTPVNILHDLAESIRKKINNLFIPTQISLILEQQSNDKRAWDLFNDLSPKDVCSVCNLLLGIDCKKGVHATPDDVINCLVMFQAAVQFTKNCEVSKQRITKKIFYNRYIDGSVQFAWTCVCTLLGGRQDKGQIVKPVAGMILMNMGQPDSRGRIRGNMHLPQPFQFDSNNFRCSNFKDLFDHLHKFGLFLKESYQGARKSLYLAATSERASEFMLLLLHPGKISNNLIFHNSFEKLNSDTILNADEAGTSSFSLTVQDEAFKTEEDDKTKGERAVDGTTEINNAKIIADLGTDSLAKKRAIVFNNGQTSTSNTCCEAENNTQGTSQKIHQNLHKKGQEDQSVQEQNMLNSKCDFVHVSIEDAKTFHKLLDLLPSAELIDNAREKNLVMDLSDRVKFKNSYPVNKIIFEEFMR